MTDQAATKQDVRAILRSMATLQVERDDLRRRIAILEGQAMSLDADLKALRERACALMRNYWDETGIKSMELPEGKLSVEFKAWAEVVDPDAFLAWIESVGRTDLVEKKVRLTRARPWVDQLLAEGQIVVGVEVTEKEQYSVSPNQAAAFA